MLSIKRIEAADGVWLELQCVVGNPTDHVLTMRLATTPEQLKTPITTTELLNPNLLHVLVGSPLDNAGLIDLLGAKPIYPQIAKIQIEYFNLDNMVADILAKQMSQRLCDLLFEQHSFLTHMSRPDHLMDIAEIDVVIDPIAKVVIGAEWEADIDQGVINRTILQQLGCTSDNIPVPYLINYGSDFDPTKPVVCHTSGDLDFYFNATPTQYSESLSDLSGAFNSRWVKPQVMETKSNEIRCRTSVFGWSRFIKLEQELEVVVPGLGICRALWTTTKGSYMGYVYERQS